MDSLINNLFISIATDKSYVGYILKSSDSIFLFGFISWKKRLLILHGKNISVSTTGISYKTFTIDSLTQFIDHDNNDFSIFFSNGSTLKFRTFTIDEKIDWLLKLKNIQIITNYLDNFSYSEKDILGSGASANVYKIKHSEFNNSIELANKSQDYNFALKKIHINNENHQKEILCEVNILKIIAEEISHPNLIKVHKIIHFGSTMYMFFPIYYDGDLSDYVKQNGFLSEKYVKIIIKQIALGLHALHKHNIAHLDIKLENILIDNNTQIKIIDFGLSKIINDNNNYPTIEQMQEKYYDFIFTGTLPKVVGTIDYLAPEIILLKYYSKCADIWSLGIIMYILLTGYYPFCENNNRTIIEKNLINLNGPLNNDRINLDNINASIDAKKIMSEMICYNVHKRITIDKIILSEWLN